MAEGGPGVRVRRESQQNLRREKEARGGRVNGKKDANRHMGQLYGSNSAAGASRVYMQNIVWHQGQVASVASEMCVQSSDG